MRLTTITTPASSSTSSAPCRVVATTGSRRARARVLALSTTCTSSSNHPSPSDRDPQSPSATRPPSPTDRRAPTATAAAAAACCCALALSTMAATPGFAAAATAPAAAAPTETQFADPAVRRAADSIADAFERRQYYVTGDLPEGLFDDQCVFVDPTTRVVGAQKYAAAVASLFDAQRSRADLLAIAPGPEPRSVEIRWRLEGRLALPGNPRVKAYTGSTLYRLSDDGDDGAGGARARVREQVETWDISAVDAFASSFLPEWLWQGAPAAPPVEVLLAGGGAQQSQGGQR